MAFMSTQAGGHQAGVTEPYRRFAVGDVIHGNQGSAWYCVKAAEALPAYAAVTFDESFAGYRATKANVDAGHRIGVAQQALAVGEYGFVQVSGVMRLLVKASCLADVALYTSATPGYLDDDATSQTKVTGIVLTTARGGTDGDAPALARTGLSAATP